MGGGGQDCQAGGLYTWAEVQQHSRRGDQWIVIDRKVYNVSEWVKRHPGGHRVISHYAGEDATDAFVAFHPQRNFVHKFLKPLLLGELAPSEPFHDHQKNVAVIKDFRALRERLERDGLFQTSPLFFCLYLGHLLLLEMLSLLILWIWGIGWAPTLLSVVILTTSQGASAGWWNHLHFQHHAKPNVFGKDPDVNTQHAFVVGSIQPIEYGIKKLKYLPYNHQHLYFFLIGPPLIIPVIFNLQNLRIMLSRRLWLDLAWWLSFYLRFFYSYVPFYGVFGSVALISFVRFLESHWFVWVTQMNHIPMNIDHEKRQDWVTMQLSATCNVKQSFFNDWFSGHLNFQIEHHLFPTMPRHNYWKAAPMVRELCEKHGIPYQVKSLWQGFTDIVSSLKNSGDLWLDAYLHK